MAKINFGVGMVCDFQAALGTINATIRDMDSGEGSGTAGAIISFDGAVLGDRESGDAESGITLPEHERIVREVADVSGSFTRQAGSFLREAINGFEITFQLKGNGRTATAGTPVDADMIPATGIDAILQAMGWTGGAWAGGIGHQYLPADAVPLTAKLWIGSGSTATAVVLQDVFVNGSITWPPGDVGLVTASFEVGSVAAFETGATFPTFDYSEQQGAPAAGDADQTISAPVVQATAHSWSTSRGFVEQTWQIDQAIEDVPDSNQATGLYKRQTGRTITPTLSIFTDSTDDDYERASLIATAIPSDSLSFTVGTATVAAGIVNAYTPVLTSPAVRKVKYNKVGASVVAEVELMAVDATADTEAELRFI